MEPGLLLDTTVRIDSRYNTIIIYIFYIRIYVAALLQSAALIVEIRSDANRVLRMRISTIAPRAVFEEITFASAYCDPTVQVSDGKSIYIVIVVATNGLC